MQYSNKFVSRSGLIAAGAMAIAVWTVPASADFNWGYYKLDDFQMTKQVPGYGKGVEFDSEWPTDALVVGQRSVKTPIYAQITQSLVETVITGGWSAGEKYAYKAMKALTWAVNAAKPGAEFKDMIPLGICIGTKDYLKDKVGQFDPDTGIIGTAKPSCHFPVHDGRGVNIVNKTKDFKVLALTPVLGQWVDKNTYNKSRAYLQRASFDPHNEICRIQFADSLGKMSNAVKKWWNQAQEKRKGKAFRVPGAPGRVAVSKGLPQLKTKMETLPGRLYNGKCYVPYKDPLLGVRFPTVSDNYEVLLIQTDAKAWVREGGKNVNLRRTKRPLAIQHVQSGLCLGEGVGLILTNCHKKDKVKGRSISQPQFFMEKNGNLRTRTGKCVISQGTKNGIELGKCSPDPHFTWFVNEDGHLKGSWGRCLVVNKSNQKPGGIVDMEHGHSCARKLGAAYQWRVLPYQKLMVKRTGKINGQVGVTSALNPKSSYPYNCLAKGCASMHRPGEKVVLTAKPIGGNEALVKFGAWKGAGCKAGVNPCKIKIEKGKTYNATFTMASAFTVVKPPKLFQIQSAGACVTISNVIKPNNKRLSMQKCSANLETQLFQAEVLRSGQHRFKSRHLPREICIFQEIQQANAKTGLGFYQGHCREASKMKNIGSTEWIATKVGELRPRGRDHCLTNAKGKLIYLDCKKTKEQKWTLASAKYTGKGWGKFETVTLQVKHAATRIDNTGSKKIGAQPHIWDCDAKNPNQQYELVTSKGGMFALKSKKSGLCLGIDKGKAKNRARALQFKCDGSNNQNWMKFGDYGGYFQLMNQIGNSMCLDAAGARHANGTKLQLWECDSKGKVANQLFRVATPAILKQAALKAEMPNRIDAIRTFQAKFSNKCIDNTGSKNSGVQAHQWSCNTKLPAQQFLIRPGRSGGTYMLLNQQSRLCLDLRGGGKKNGTAVQQYKCNVHDNQSWRFVAKGGDWYEIRSKTSNKCLDVRGASKKNGAKIQTWDCKNVPQQMFKVVK